MQQLFGAFAWQLVKGLADDAFAQGLLPTQDEKRRRSDSTLGTMLVFGNLTLCLQSVIWAVAIIVWLATGRGRGGKLLAAQAGSPMVPPVMRARVGAYRRATLADWP